MVTKCYIIEWNTNNENLFDDLFNAGIMFRFCRISPNYFEISITVYETNVAALEELMKWYV